LTTKVPSIRRHRTHSPSRFLDLEPAVLSCTKDGEGVGVGVGALEIKNRDGEWVAVPPIEGTFVSMWARC